MSDKNERLVNGIHGWDDARHIVENRRHEGVTDEEIVALGFAVILTALKLDLDVHVEETPARAARAWYTELCAGITQDPPSITAFPRKGEEQPELILLRDIPVKSLCAHHLLPFIGTATIGYIPGKPILLGLSKLSRVVDYWARRPQVQERLTTQIANTLGVLVMDAHDLEEPGGVGVVIRANHMCMQCRGVNHPGDMVTSALRGVFVQPEVRAEFLDLAKGC